MYCAQCGERAEVASQLYCQSCGGALARPELDVVTNRVGDGRKRVAFAYAMFIAPRLARRPRSLLVWAVAAVVVATVALAAVVAVIGLLVAAAAALAPVAFVIAVLLLARRPRRRRRRRSWI